MKTLTDFDSDVMNYFEECFALYLVIKTKSGKVEFREERGKWFQELSQQLQKLGMEAYRTTWDEACYIKQGTDIQQSQENIANLLIANTHRELDSYALLSIIPTTNEARGKWLENMQLQLHKINYWTDHIYEHYYLNGVKTKLQ